MVRTLEFHGCKVLWIDMLVVAVGIDVASGYLGLGIFSPSWAMFAVWTKIWTWHGTKEVH